MKDILNKLFSKTVLTRQEAKHTLTEIASGVHNDSLVASFLTVYMMRDLQAQELAGFRDAMLDLCLSVDLSHYDAMDICGTGGDGKDTFNISTTTSFVLAGAGQNVVKHGNSAVSSKCGSSDLLLHLGYKFSNDPEKLKSDLDKAGICYLHAPLFHPAMKNVAHIRKDLGLKTFFNLLGPLLNPSKPSKQLVGVYKPEIIDLYQNVLKTEGIDFGIVHSFDGYDEISLTGPFKLATKDKVRTITPEEIGLKTYKPEDLSGGNSLKESAEIFMSVLENNSTEAQRDVVIANAGISLYIAGKSPDIKECIDIARESLVSGKALASFKKLID